MFTDSVRPKVGILPLALEYYDTAVPNLKSQRETWIQNAVMPALEDIADVHFPGILNTRPQIEAAVTQFETAGLNCILVLMATYSPSLLSAPRLQKTNLPIIVWNTQELFAVENDLDVPLMLSNHGVHGTQDLCNVLLRNEVSFGYVTSHLNDSDSVQALLNWFTAAGAVQALRRTRIGLIGYPFPGMGDFAIDSALFSSTLGCEVVPLTVADLIDASHSLAKESLEELVSEYRELYQIADNVTEDDLIATAQTELAMRMLVEKHDLRAITYQFLAFQQHAKHCSLPFVAASRLMADGIGFAGEGDVLGAATCRLLHTLHPPAGFTEIFTVDFAGNSLFMSHMGEINVGMADPNHKIHMLAQDKPILQSDKKQLVLIPTLRKEPVTLFALTQGEKQRMKIIASRLDCTTTKRKEKLQVPHFHLRPTCDIREFCTKYALAGGPHHNVICYGDAREKLRITAKLLNVDYLEV